MVMDVAFSPFPFVHSFSLLSSSPCLLSKPNPSCANCDFEKVVTHKDYRKPGGVELILENSLSQRTGLRGYSN